MASVVPYWGWVLFVIGGIASLAIGLVMGMMAAWRSREKRDGLR